MYGIAPVYGEPRMGTAVKAQHRRVFRGTGPEAFLPGGKIIDGAKSRDPGNSPDVDVLRAGLLLGKLTSGGLYAPSIIGTLTGAAAAAATTVNVSAAAATEIVRRIGTTGTLRFVGPPTAGGVVATFTETYSAVNTTTGAITVSALDAALIQGSFVCADDGTYLPITFIPDEQTGWGIKVTDQDGTNLSVPLPLVPVMGIVTSSQLVNWPSDTSLQKWVKDQLNGSGLGHFTFDDGY
jgi:hypothetical protein